MSNDAHTPKPAHTATPWAYEHAIIYADVGIQPHIAYLRDESGNYLTDYADDNGQFIVKAINAHDTLTELVREMKTALEAYETLDCAVANCDEHDCGLAPELCGECFPFADDARLKMRAALTKAKEAGIE